MSKIINNLYTKIIYTVYIASTIRKNVFVGVGRNVTVTRKITESILFPEISRELNSCVNSVYNLWQMNGTSYNMYKMYIHSVSVP